MLKKSNKKDIKMGLQDTPLALKGEGKGREKVYEAQHTFLRCG